MGTGLLARGAALLAAATLVTAPVRAGAQTPELLDTGALRVCADPNSLPFSNEKQEGYENRIAAIIGRELGRTVEYTWFPQGPGFIRATLRARRCDVVIGTVEGSGEGVQNTVPYLHSTYLMFYRSDRGPQPQGIDDPVLRDLRIGVVARTPPSDLLLHRQLLAKARAYALVVDTRFESPTKQLIDDLMAGEIDVGMLWGPIIGYYAARDHLPVRLVPLKAAPGEPRLDYEIGMGVRPNENEWRRTLNGAIEARRGDIAAVLKEFGIPMLGPNGQIE